MTNSQEKPLAVSSIDRQLLSEQRGAETRAKQFDNRTENERNRPERERAAERERATKDLGRINQELPIATNRAADLRRYLDESKDMLGGSSLDAAYDSVQRAESTLRSLKENKQKLEARLKALGDTAVQSETPDQSVTNERPAPATGESSRRSERVYGQAVVEKLEQDVSALPEFTDAQRETVQAALKLEEELEEIADNSLTHMAVRRFVAHELGKGDWHQPSQREIDDVFEKKFGSRVDDLTLDLDNINGVNENDVRNKMKKNDMDRTGPLREALRSFHEFISESAEKTEREAAQEPDGTKRETAELQREREQQIRALSARINHVVDLAGKLDPESRTLMGQVRKMKTRLLRTVHQDTYNRLTQQIHEKTGM